MLGQRIVFGINKGFFQTRYHQPCGLRIAQLGQHVVFIIVLRLKQLGERFSKFWSWKGGRHANNNALVLAHAIALVLAHALIVVVVVVGDRRCCPRKKVAADVALYIIVLLMPMMYASLIGFDCILIISFCGTYETVVCRNTTRPRLALDGHRRAKQIKKNGGCFGRGGGHLLKFRLVSPSSKCIWVTKYTIWANILTGFPTRLLNFQVSVVLRSCSRFGALSSSKIQNTRLKEDLGI